MKTNTRQNISKVRILFLLLIAVIVLFAGVDRSFAYSETTIYTSSSGYAPKGIALDQQANRLYFLEYSSGQYLPGTLRYLDLMDNNSANDVNSQVEYATPIGVELDTAANSAYITTNYRLNPPSIGALWKTAIPAGTKELRAFNTGFPKQMALDMQNSCAYLVSASEGLIRVDLNTYEKETVYSGSNFSGVALSNDGQIAYVSANGAQSKILKIDLNQGTILQTLPLGTDRHFFMEWTDPGRTSLYVVVRSGTIANAPYKIKKVDLTTSQVTSVITGILPSISDLTVNQDGTEIYISTGNKIKKYSMVDFDLANEPVFLGVGNIPVSCIEQSDNDKLGLATTAATYSPHVTDAPFGGTLNIFGNLTNFASLGAAYYAVYVQKDDGGFEALDLSWTAYKWNTSSLEFESVTVAPDPNAPASINPPVYRIPQEYGTGQSQLCYPSYLMMRWPSGENGLYTFKVELFNSVFDASTHQLTIRVDNTPPTAIINQVLHNVPPLTEVDACGIVNNGPNEFYFKITASDDNQHLLSYRLTAHWGNNQFTPITSDNYGNNNGNAPYWGGVVNFVVPSPPNFWSAQENCAHTFSLRVWKRTTNGYHRFLHSGYQKSITINLPALD